MHPLGRSTRCEQLMPSLRAVAVGGGAPSSVNESTADNDTDRSLIPLDLQGGTSAMRGGRHVPPDTFSGKHSRRPTSSA